MGLDSYAYCLNDPIYLVDDEGYRPAIGAFNPDGDDEMSLYDNLSHPNQNGDEDEDDEQTIIYGYKEHNKHGTTNPSNRNKHQNGQARKNRDQNKTEKGDERRKVKRNPKRRTTAQRIAGGITIAGLVVALIVVADDATGVGIADDATIPVIITGILEIAGAM